MAKINKLINFLETFDDELQDEIYNREDQANEQEYKWEGYRDSEKGTEYIYKTEALDELRELIFEVVEQAKKIKNKEY
jgi:hypothetical protein